MGFFFFKQKTAYEIRSGDWSSDVCSSDLKLLVAATAIIAAFGINTTTTHAAKYSKTEAKQVRHFQKRYHALSKVKYNKQNIYAQQPNFGLPFSAGSLNPS